jgi:hypothetical protein
MWFRVAALLGGRTVEELQSAMSSDEFTSWCEFYALEPWGSDVENWRMGVVAAVTANYSGRAKRSLDPSDFVPGRTKRMSVDESRKALESMKRNG